MAALVGGLVRGSVCAAICVPQSLCAGADGWCGGFSAWGDGTLMYHPDILSPPEACPALVLNADYTPLSYYPLSLWSWQTAIKAAFLQRVDIIAEYDRVIRSPNLEMRLPSVIALRD